MTTTMVFIHGRGQEFKDPAKLIASWRSGLARGQLDAGLPGLDGVPAVLPFYGNVLYQVTADLERNGPPIHLEALPEDVDEPGPLHPALSKEVGAVERELMTDLAVEANAPLVHEEGLIPKGVARVLSWGAVRQALLWVAKTAGVDREVIKGQLKDVAVYLAGAGARDRVLATVQAGIPDDGKIVLVTHSLGTVVARDLLDDPAIRQRTVAWVTLGSPLGLPTVQRNLKTKGPHHPENIDWQTGYDTNDVVALGHPLRPTWGDPLADIRVENGNAPHDIERYLSHPEVAEFIYRAATAL
ncbi:MAG TPA: hypothetical protein VGJ44_09590 [Kribbellaceae bacterium]|jgi:hypothetical protein